MNQRIMTNKHMNCFTEFMGFALVFLLRDRFHNPVIVIGVDVIFTDCVHHEHVGTFISLLRTGCLILTNCVYHEQVQY